MASICLAWLCANHARQIDANRGEKFPPPLLQSYKNLHEARIAREQGGIHTPFGWIQQVRIFRSPILKSRQTINFGKVTLITGDNGSGKTAIAEWVLGSSDPMPLNRWFIEARPSEYLSYELTVFNPEKKILAVSCDAEGIHYSVDGRFTAVPYSSIKFLRLQDISVCNNPEFDALHQLSIKLGVDKMLIRNVLERLGTSVKGSVSNARIERVRKEYSLILDVCGTHNGLNFFQLSAGEKALVAIDIAIALAQSYAEFGPTILIIDQGYQIDRKLLQKYVDYLALSEHLFQTVMVLPDRNININWTGWEIVHLLGVPPHVTVTQSFNEL